MEVRGSKIMSTTLAIDFGSRNVGIALVQHCPDEPNRVLYAATLLVEAKPLKASVKPRATARRTRRTRKTHRRRLRRLAQALHGIPGVEGILRFCRRRGYSHDPEEPEDAETRALRFSREDFFQALRREIDRTIEPAERQRVLRACSRHLNESRRRAAELRPARFENRGTSKCQWEGCRRNVPRADHAFKERLQQALFAWLKPVFDVSADPQRLRRSIDHWIAELDGLARWHAKIDKADKEAAKEERESIDKRKRLVYKNLCARVRREAPKGVAEKFQKHWRKKYRRDLTNIVTGKRGGRVPYCREHSQRFVDFFLAGEQIPNRTDVREADLFGRTQQILFARLWRLTESRLLPLGGGRIDRVVVERVAIDVLAGKAKKRRELSETTAAEMYWHGPQYGFSSRLEMLREEFDGRCAYCGQPGAASEVEHLLPRSQFPFDSYFNLLPACQTCNEKKGARTAMAAGMKVHEESYQAYADYVAGLRIPHVFHTIKKGLLKLLSREEKPTEVERKLGMLADNLLIATTTQKGPRPLARYLAGKLEKVSGHRPAVGYVAGRHTAMYRSIILPEYDKAAEKAEGDLINHAIDAILLGCQLPSAAGAENRRWYARAEDINAWREKVREFGPALEDGLPRVARIDLIPHFEQDLGSGYCAIDLSAFGWNRTRQSGYNLEPVGKTKAGLPIHRERASKVLANLQDPDKRASQISRTAHPALRKLLESDPAKSPERFVRWLQQTTKAGLSAAKMSNHPSDRARKRMLMEFVDAPVERFLNSGDDHQEIPGLIGVRCLALGLGERADVARCDQQGKVFQYYTTDPHVKALYVGYRVKNESLDRSKPVRFWVNQMYALTVEDRKNTAAAMPDVLRCGRPLGSKGSLKQFLAEWRQAFDDFCRQLEIVKRFCITQGCVIEKTDGTRFQLRNFDKASRWMKGSPFKDIRRVFRSPIRLLKDDEGAKRGTAQDVEQRAAGTSMVSTRPACPSTSHPRPAPIEAEGQL
jgi:5-methylcytosine-specific restriction endonuclease McrA